MQAIIDDIPFEPDFDQLLHPFGLKPGSPKAAEFQELLLKGQSIAKPKVMYKVVPAETDQVGIVRLNGFVFESRVLWSNFQNLHRAFPYVVTSGIELHQWKNSFEDIFTSYIADLISTIALENTVEIFLDRLKLQYGLSTTSSMNPGSPKDWPLQAQTSLFSLLGDTEKSIGVTLTDRLLMIPQHSVSGILFETESSFVNCKLCPRESCQNRRVPFDEDLAGEYLKPQSLD